MLLNYLKVALKVLWRRKFFTGVSLFGVAFTLTVLLVVTAFIDHVLSPVPPEVNLGRTLHVSFVLTRIKAGGETTKSSWSSPGYGLLDRHARDLPGVERTSIFSSVSDVTSLVDGQSVRLRTRSTDGPYWEILSFRFLEGGPLTQQDDDGGRQVAVITESARRRLFGAGPAVSRSFDLDGRAFQVVGVVEDVDTTRFSADADLWIPHGARKSQDFRRSLFGSFQALLLAESRESFPAIKEEFASRLRHLPPTAEGEEAEVLGTPRTRLEELAYPGSEEEFRNPPVHKIVWQYVGGVLLWMFLPAVNLMSLNLSRIIERSPEIGVRKAFGASTPQLVGQFVFENVLLCLIGSVLALGGAAVAARAAELSGWLPHLDIRLSYRVFLYAAGFACLFGAVSGALPAWRMSRLHPVQALRGDRR